MTLNLVVAHNLAQGRFFARNIKGWSNREWALVTDNLDRLRGLSGSDVVVWIVEAAGYEMTARERNYWFEAKYILEAQKHRVKIEVGLLP